MLRSKHTRESRRAPLGSSCGYLHRKLAAVFASIALIALGQINQQWRDASDHRLRMVRVAEGVDLEVLDWGGEGRPLVLLSGYLTAHAYDEIAPRLTARAHVYGITRRGLGASSRPPSGYTAVESARDVVQVLGHLELSGAVLAGHSFGGQDLTTIATHYPERTAGLIYLNSGEDPTLTAADYGAKPPDGKRLPKPLRTPDSPDKSSPAAYRTWQLRTHGVAFPESEVRHLYSLRSDGTLGEYQVPKEVRRAMENSLIKPDFARIRVPVLAFFAEPPTGSELLAKYNPATEDELAALKEKRAFDAVMLERHIRDLRAGVPEARVVRLPGANSYIFLSNPDELVREIRSFLDELR
jgi:pimeloyl-ACP methyl ester carboxylesterase